MDVRCVVPLEIAARPPALGAVVHRLAGTTMGTTWELRVAAAPGLPLAALRRAVEHELALVVAQMSHWEPASDLSRFNRAAAGSVHVLPVEMAEVLACALDVARASGGAFDPCAGALVDAWGFGAGHPHARPGFRAPDDAAIAAALARGGWQRLAFDAASHRAEQPGGLALDLSAIAKGHAVDRVAGALERAGLPDHLVEIGGELRGGGLKPDGQPWWVALETPPDAAGTAPARIALHGLAVATSGDYRRVFDDRGVRRPHTLDPRSGRPIAHGLASVSVLHRSCVQADAWSTALTVMGLEAGLACADSRGLAAHFVQRGSAGEGIERASNAWSRMCD